MLAVAGLVVAAAAFALTLGVFLHERRRHPEPNHHNERLRASIKQRSVGVWTVGRFYQSLLQFDDYCDLVNGSMIADSTSDPSVPSAEDLLRFAEAVLLTAAADILPFSQGKANLFRFADCPNTEKREIVSSGFIGVFPPSQVLAGSAFRTLRLDRDHEATSAAGECVRLRLPRIFRITKKSAVSGEEIALGTTHILGIPTQLSMTPGRLDLSRIPIDQPAAITVDLRIIFARPLLPLIRRFAYRRARFVCHRLHRYSILLAQHTNTRDANRAT